jgi:hypothetical protein
MTRGPSDVVLARGDHPEDEGMSIAEAVASYAGERRRVDFRQRPACASPALIEWMITWADLLDDDDRQQLGRYIPLLAASRGTEEQETTRVWRILDWVIRTDAPLWLHGLQLSRHASALAALHPIRDPQDLADVHPTIRDAVNETRSMADNLWRLVADDAQLTVLPAQPQHGSAVPAADLGPYEPARARRLETWALVADATTTAIHAAQTLLDCATSAAGYRTATDDELPVAVGAVAQVIDHAATGIAWRAVRSLTKRDTWSWEAGAEAALTTGAAVRSALRPTEDAVRQAAHDLMGQMLP